MRNKIEWGKEDEHKEKTEYFCFGFAVHSDIASLPLERI